MKLLKNSGMAIHAALSGAFLLLFAAAAVAGADTHDLFEEAAVAVEANFYDRAKASEAVALARRRRLEGAQTSETATEALLASLAASHTGRYKADAVAYYELLAIYGRAFDPAQMRRRFPPDGAVAYDGIGIAPRLLAGRWHAAGVYHGGPADQAGLKHGDELIAVNDRAYSPIDAFRDLGGQMAELQVRRTAAGPIETVRVAVTRIRPDELFLSALQDSARVVEIGGARVGYVRVWSYAGQRYQDALAEVLSRGRLKDADALVLDLRGGWGGAQPHYVELFAGRAPTMVFRGPDGAENIFSFRWRRPLVVLVDEGTRSGKEVVTFGLKRAGAPVVGSRTAGAVLAGRGFALSDDSLLVLAVRDVTVDGVRLEGRGVEADVTVPLEIAYAAGADPQLDRAIAEAARLLGRL